MAASGTVSVAASFNYTKVASSIASYQGTPSISTSNSYSSTDITKLYQGVATITVATTLDVSSLTDDYGAALSFTVVKAVIIYNTSASATLTIGGGATPLYGTDQITLKAGQSIPLTSSITTSGSIKSLRLTPSASCGYQIIIVGT